jgi:cytochrome c553
MAAFSLRRAAAAGLVAGSVAVLGPLLSARASDDAERANSPLALADMMLIIQTRHAKLWYAGQAQNWKLADFLYEETQSMFNQIMITHPTYDGHVISELMPLHTARAMVDLQTALRTKDKAAFTRAYDDLTTSCNGCHEASDHGFIVVTRPSVPPMTNQDYRPRP